MPFHPPHVLWGEGAKTLLLKGDVGDVVFSHPLLFLPVLMGPNRCGWTLHWENECQVFYNVDSAVLVQPWFIPPLLALFLTFLPPPLFAALALREGAVLPETGGWLSCGTRGRLGWPAAHLGV